MPASKHQWNFSSVVASSLFHALFNQENYKEAKERVGVIHDYNPDDNIIFIYYGVIYYEIGQLEKFKSNFAKAFVKEQAATFRGFPRKI